jgi:hypothetical protein
MAANNAAAPAPGGSAPATTGAAPDAAGASGDGAPRANRQGGQRPGGAGGFRGPNGQQFTPEQIEQFQRMRANGGGAGGFGGFRGMGAPGAGADGRQPQQRRGIVMVKKADGTLEQRQVVVGVNDRVRGQVIEGLNEGEEVVVGKRETEPQTGPTAAGATQNNNNNNNFRGNQGGFPGGGNFRPF